MGTFKILEGDALAVLGGLPGGVFALRLGRSFVGIDLNAEYCAMARRRIWDDAPLLNGVCAAED